MRVHVNGDRCQGHTLCHIAAPDVFHLAVEDGHAYVIDPMVPGDSEQAVLQARDTCPEQAIEVGEQ
jgi:ferredoxin